MIAFSNVDNALRAAVPEFGPTIDEHLAYYDGLLQHLLFADLARFVLAARQDGDQQLVERTLGFLELALRQGDEDVRNLVGVSFVENVGPGDGRAWEFISGWPPALRAEAEAQRDWKPDVS